MFRPVLLTNPDPYVRNTFSASTSGARRRGTEPRAAPVLETRTRPQEIDGGLARVPRPLLRPAPWHRPRRGRRHARARPSRPGGRRLGRRGGARARRRPGRDGRLLRAGRVQSDWDPREEPASVWAPGAFSRAAAALGRLGGEGSPARRSVTRRGVALRAVVRARTTRSSRVPSAPRARPRPSVPGRVGPKRGPKPARSLSRSRCPREQLAPAAFEETLLHATGLERQPRMHSEPETRTASDSSGVLGPTIPLFTARSTARHRRWRSSP